MQRIFLRWARPLAPAAAALVYLVAEAAATSRNVLDILFVPFAWVGAGIVYLVASRTWDPTAVLRVALPVETVPIAGMTVAPGRGAHTGGGR